MLGVIGIIISLVLLMYLAYRGWSIVLLAPVLALLAAAFQIGDGSGFHGLAVYTEDFMVSLAGYVRSYFPLFMLGAVFGKVMDASGSADSIATFFSERFGHGKETLAIVLACAVITYGGVSLFVAAFAIYPIGAALFRQSDIPKRLLPPAIALGSFTFTMTAIPGSPQIQNAIPMKYFGTDAFAAPILGVVAACIMFFGGMWWLRTRYKKALANGETYGHHPNENLTIKDKNNLPPFGVAITPIIVVIAANFVFSKMVFPGMEADYLTEVYNTTLGAVMGNWAIICSLLIGIILTVALNFNKYDSVTETLKDGVAGSFLAIMNTASEVGYGNVIKTLAGFAIISNVLLNTFENPLISQTLATTVLAGITGSASGGMSIALEAFGPIFLERANAIGLDPEVLHRVASVASGGCDTMPHNGAVITLLAVTGMTHKECYPNICVLTVIIPLISAAVIIALGTIGIV